MSVTSYAQLGEDLQIAYFIGGSKKKKYIDVGALWPQDLSNSYHFYERGGFGLCIEPNPEVSDDFQRERPRDTFLNIAIGAAPGRLEYHMYSNPVFNTFSAERAAFVKRKALTRSGRDLVRTVEIDVATLDQAVESTRFADRCDGTLDFLSVDVEGLEAAVIGGFSFDLLRPKLVVLEHIRRRRSDPPPETSDLHAAMRELGYWMAGYTGHDMYFLDEKE